MTTRSLLLVGCGRMGSALLSRWKKAHPAGITNYWVIDPTSPPMHGMKSSWVSSLQFLPARVQPHIIVFATKPQQLARILPGYRRRFGIKPLYISIAAGKPLSFYAKYLDMEKAARVVRVMPNTPAMVGSGMSVLCAARRLSSPARKIATELMEAVGDAVWVKNEALMDAVTAISGSGPAYVFLFLDALTKAGVKAGLAPDIARQLAIETVSGSCDLARESSHSFEELRQHVTSPGGTTEAALSLLMRDNRFQTLMAEAIEKAVLRSQILSQ